MGDVEWNDFLGRLKVAINKVINNLAGHDVRRKFLHELLLTVLRVAAISVQDAQKVITDEMLVTLENLKGSFSRDLRKIYQQLQRLHVQAVPEQGQGNQSNNPNKRKHTEGDLENFVDDDATSLPKLAKLQQETENESTTPVTTKHSVNGELANEMKPTRKINDQDSQKPEEEVPSSTFSALQ